MAQEHVRPSPDELLARVKAEEEREKRGKLKIFLGYAPGVGKTYTMLEAARLKKKDTDVAVAIVETHGRAETEALLEGLEIVPRRQVEYRGIKLTEMDLDAVLKRHPRLAVVDEVAHENAPGSRHPKRYQDIEELLDAGIDVYTTLNVQHIESGRNAVAQITGVWVRETVPDSLVDSASEIEMIDLPPDELIQRLKEGKVYIPEQIAPASESFFRKGNLTALRELTMRTAARHVDEETLAYMKAHAIAGPWPSAERVLVCVTPGPAGIRLVRNARRLAYQLGAEWSAIYIETPGASLSPGQQERLTNSLRMAERMGAKVATVQGQSVIGAIIEFAAKNNITKIVVGKSRRSWRSLFGQSIVDQLIRQSEHFDVYIVGGRGEPAPPEPERLTEKGRPHNWMNYWKGLGLVLLATLIGQLMHTLFTTTTIAMLYMLCVVITAYVWGLGPSIVVSILGVLAFDFFHVPPYLSFEVEDTQYIFTFLILLGVGVIISYLTLRVHRQTEAASQRERQTAALFALGRDLAVTSDLESYIRAIVKRARETFGHRAAIFLPDPRNKETLKRYDDTPQGAATDENELAAAIWAYRHQRMVGHGTDTLPNAKARYLPLVTAGGTVGVISISATDSGTELTIEQERLLEAYADLAAVALESILLGRGTPKP